MRILFAGLFFVFSCATDVPTTPEKKETVPFVKRYKKGAKELLYFVYDDQNLPDEKTKELLQTTVKRFDPEIVITKLLTEDKAQTYQIQNRCEVAPKYCPMEYWSCNFVKPRGIPCVSGHPYQSEVFRRAETLGKSSDEILFFTTYRFLVEKSTSEKAPLNELDGQIEKAKELLNIVSPMGREDFLAHYRDHMGRGPVILTPRNLWPVPNGNHLQTTSAVMTRATDELIFEEIRKEQLAHERVLVIYGKGHFRAQRGMLEKFFSTELP